MLIYLKSSSVHDFFYNTDISKYVMFDYNSLCSWYYYDYEMCCFMRDDTYISRLVIMQEYHSVMTVEEKINLISTLENILLDKIFDNL